MKALHLHTKLLLSVSIASILLLPISYNTTFAQYSMSSTTVTANSDGSVNVFQSIDLDGVTANVQVQTFGTSIHDIIATDETNTTLYTDVDSDGIVIDTLGSERVSLSYFADGLLMRNSDLRSLSFTSTEDVQIILPAGAEILYISDIPLYEDSGIIFMEAGTIEIDYILHEVVTKEFVIDSGVNESIVTVSSAATIADFAFTQENKKISFTVDRANMPVTLMIPIALMESPFAALMNGNSITHSVYFSTDTHTWIMLEPNEVGRVMLFSGTTVPEFHGKAEVKVIAKQIRDLVLLRVTNDKDSTAGIYGLTVKIDSGIDAFKGPNEWSRISSSTGPVTSSTDDDPIVPGKRTVFRLKVEASGPTIGWKVHDQSGSILEEGTVKPFMFGIKGRN